MLDQLRKLGLVVEIDDSKVILREPFNAARQGEPLTPEQAKLLVHLERKLVAVSFRIVSHWCDGQFQEFQ
jgi:Insertion domain in 60S ribosomal protein L10P